MSEADYADDGDSPDLLQRSLTAAAPSHTSRSKTVDPAEVAHLQVHYAVFGPILPRQTDTGAEIYDQASTSVLCRYLIDFQILTRAVAAVCHLYAPLELIFNCPVKAHNPGFEDNDTSPLNTRRIPVADNYPGGDCARFCGEALNASCRQQCTASGSWQEACAGKPGCWAAGHVFFTSLCCIGTEKSMGPLCGFLKVLASSPSGL
jgi:hypothetical protein